MAGILLIVLMIGYVTLAFWLVVKVKPIWIKALTLIVFILIPTADEFYYSYKLNKFCENEAVVHVNSIIPSTAGIYFGSWSGDFYFKKLGLNLVEWKAGVNQELYRLSRDSSVGIKKEKISNIKSQYAYSLVEKKTSPFLYQSFRLENMDSKVITSEFRNVAYYGGWFQRKLLGKLSDSGPTLVADCGLEKTSSPVIELLKKSISN